MSDQENNPPEPNTPSADAQPPAQPPGTSRITTKTSQVPLKTSRVSLSGKPDTKTSQIPLRKETVRITLKAAPEPKDATGAARPLAAPPTGTTSGIASPRPPSGPPSSVVRPVPQVAPTVPLRPTPPPGGAAPTVPLRKPPSGPTPTAGSAPAAPATTPLKATPAPTIPLRTGPGATQSLPQATTKLRSTQPLAATPTAALPVVTPATAEAHEESDVVNSILAALILLTTIFLGAVQFAKSRVSEVKEIGTVRPEASWTDLLSQ